MATKSTLNIFKSLAEVRPKDYEIARRISKVLNLGIKEEDFVNLEVIGRDTGVEDEPASSIIINLKNEEIEITILEYGYFITKAFNDNEYQFVKEYYYEVDDPITESFGINNGKCSLIIKNDIAAKSISIENEEKRLERIHIDNDYYDSTGTNVISITTFIDEMETEEYNHHNELFYFPTREDMYHTSISNRYNEYSFKAGATLNSPRYKLTPEDLTSDEIELFENVGILDRSKAKLPRIYMNSTYIVNDEINGVEIYILKHKTILGIEVVENGEPKTYKYAGTPTKNITLKDLITIKIALTKILEDKPYIDLVINYIDELVLRLTNRLQHNYENIVSYNCDIFDYYINAGKSIFLTPAMDIEHRAFEIYQRKESLERLLDVEVPDIRIKNTSNTLTKSSE